MKLALFIAWRYLFAKKSRQVINVISWISAAGIALGTMALVIVLSVYNGFDNLVLAMYRNFDSDLLIRPVAGKVFTPSPQFAAFAGDARIAAVCPVIEEDVFLQYRGQQAVATVKGVDSTFVAITPLQHQIQHGKFDVYFGELEEVVMGRGLANQLGVNVAFVDPLWIYYPEKGGAFSPLNPMGSIKREKLYPAGIFAVEQQYDSRYLFIPIATARRLFSYTDQLSYVELKLQDGVKVKPLQKQLMQQLGPDFEVLNRRQQNRTLYKMMTTEKAVIFVLLAFIVLIISCNVLGSLGMLILEKKQDVEILRSMGASAKLIKRIFLLEGWLISVLGLVAGLLLGLMVCKAQIYFGIIKLPGSFAVRFYPVDVHLTDVLLIVASVLGLGFLAAYAPVRSVFSKAVSRT